MSTDADVKTTDTHVLIKAAIHVLRTTFRIYGSKLKNDDTGEVGVSHSAVIQVAKGDLNSDWIPAKIDRAIAYAWHYDSKEMKKYLIEHGHEDLIEYVKKQYAWRQPDSPF